MRKFTKYPSNYVKATAYYVSKTQMNDWKQIAKAYARKVGAELLFVNENSFGIEYPDGTMRHIRIEDLADLLGAGDIEASNDNYTWDRNRFDTIVGKILEYWESMEEDTCTSKEIYDYLAQFGITNIDPDEFNKAWDRAVAISDAYFELEGSPVTLSNGLEISNKEEAYTWLRENVEQYGNTYFWDSSLKSDLDKLVERFGNTYFWRS